MQRWWTWFSFKFLSRQNNTKTDEGVTVIVLVVAVPLDDLVAVAVALLAVNVTPYIMHFSTHSKKQGSTAIPLQHKAIGKLLRHLWGQTPCTMPEYRTWCCWWKPGCGKDSCRRWKHSCHSQHFAGMKQHNLIAVRYRSKTIKKYGILGRLWRVSNAANVDETATERARTTTAKRIVNRIKECEGRRQDGQGDSKLKRLYIKL